MVPRSFGTGDLFYLQVYDRNDVFAQYLEASFPSMQRVHKMEALLCIQGIDGTDIFK